MIELIFAIVIMAISVMTIPLMLSQSGNNSAFSMMQESILAARTKMGNMLSYQWDRNATIAGASVTYIRVLDVANGDSELDRNDSTQDSNRRIGHITEDMRRRFQDGNSTDRTLPSTVIDLANANSISDFHGEVLVGSLVGDRGNFDYVFTDFNMSTTVSYVSDSTNYDNQNIVFDFNVSSRADITDPTQSTNIKMIELSVASRDTTPFMLRTFSCNIGQTDLFERDTTRD
ncbi:MAG: hypothetical protein K0U47_11260 [Epsilonproteobacteria bacterium]|nr:hypothetical protein [Campylobacterota bacterium]